MTANVTDEMIEVDPALRLSVRVYTKEPIPRPAPLVLHLHGGAFVGGSLDSGRTVSTSLADAGTVVVSAAYPLAPANPFPTALHAAYRALTWLHEHRSRWGSKHSRIFVAGEEAGGNLAAGVALMARDQRTPPLTGQILLSPMLDPCLATCSIRKAEVGPVGCKWADGWHQYLRSADKASHPYAAPLGSSRLAGVAPALVLTADDDPMRDESVSYAQRLRASDVAVTERVLTGPTGWPDALSNPAKTNASWAAEIRNHFIMFFDQTLARPCCASGRRPNQS